MPLTSGSSLLVDVLEMGKSTLNSIPGRLNEAAYEVLVYLAHVQLGSTVNGRWNYRTLLAVADTKSSCYSTRVEYKDTD